jgi:two-component system cell cycle response regulator
MDSSVQQKGKQERASAMTGKILIVDSVATNRIVLKVKLSAAFYQVLQAGTAQEAARIAAREQPDIILSGALPDADFPDLLHRLRRLPGIAMPPVVALLSQPDPALRILRLRQGATDVITKPVPEALLLARLRSQLRHAPRDADLGLQPAMAQALGLAEAPVGYAPPGRIAVMASTAAGAAGAHLMRLARRGAGHVIATQIARPRDLADLPRKPQLVLLAIGPEPDTPGLAMLAELRSAPGTRQARVIVMIDHADAPRAAQLLDVGAHDVVGADTPPEEIDLRIQAQLHLQQAEDTLRDQLQSGLAAAMTDPLTGLYNRRYALSQLERMIGGLPGPSGGFAVIAADLDHFKAVNDNYGHAAGDLVLTRVAGLLRGALRPGDVLARMGGEEFLMLLPGCSRAAARDLAARLCRVLRETPITIPGATAPVHVTISLGVTLAEPQANAPKPTVEGLLGQADRALYGSKSDGRDTVTFAHRPAA